MTDPGEAAKPAKNQGPVYGGFVEVRITEEENRTASLQARGLAVVTTSGALVTLLVGIAELGIGDGGADMPTLSRWLMSGAAAIFVVAAALGLGVNAPKAYARPHVTDLRDRINERWLDQRPSAAQKEVALARADQLSDLEEGNDRAVRAVKAALVVEVVATTLAAAAVVVMLVSN